MICPNPLSAEEYEALKALPPAELTPEDFERLFATLEDCLSHIEFLKRKIRRHRKALRAVSRVALDGLCFSDGLDFPMQTGVVWDDSDEYL